jgi:sulfate permease
MSATEVGLILCSMFFAMNMGGTAFAPTFSAALGAKQVSRWPAIALFTVCVLVGAYFIGPHVAKTLGGSMVPAKSIDKPTALIVIGSACAALFIANLAKVPESTSWVTVFGLISLGLVRGNLNTHTFFYKLLPSWLSVPPIAFVVTWIVTRQLYPLRGWNYRLYEHLTKHEWKMRLIVVASSCYIAISAGSNNVANVVGPVSSTGLFSISTGMVLAAPLFGIGAIFLSPAKAIGNDVVPLGLYSAAIVNVVVGTLLLIVSRLGISQSLVQTHALAVFAIAYTKEGSYGVFRHPMIRRILVYWVISPLLSATLVAVFLFVFQLA